MPFIAWWPGYIPAGTVRQQVICTHDTVATTLDLAGVSVPQDQALDSSNLVPVLLGQRDDSNPIRDHLLLQSSPGRDAFDDWGFRAIRPGQQVKESKQVDDPSRPGDEGQAPKSRRNGIAHAVYRDNWKLVHNAAGQPVALYDLSNDLAEEKNIITDRSQTERTREMSNLYERIRNSNRSVPTPLP